MAFSLVYSVQTLSLVVKLQRVHEMFGLIC